MPSPDSLQSWWSLPIIAVLVFGIVGITYVVGLYNGRAIGRGQASAVPAAITNVLNKLSPDGELTTSAPAFQLPMRLIPDLSCVAFDAAGKPVGLKPKCSDLGETQVVTDATTYRIRLVLTDKSKTDKLDVVFLKGATEMEEMRLTIPSRIGADGPSQEVSVFLMGESSGAQWFLKTLNEGEGPLHSFQAFVGGVWKSVEASYPSEVLRSLSVNVAPMTEFLNDGTLQITDGCAGSEGQSRLARFHLRPIVGSTALGFTVERATQVPRSQVCP